ncbi:MAG: FmdB family zinc ribbon protein [Oscillochloridaceae bacterium umkhey_bin13]
MPTYVYACDGCGKQFEQFQSFKDEPLTVCPCGQSGKVRRVIQPAGIVFKGSGWYINDSRGTGSSTVSSETTKSDAPKQPEEATPSAETPATPKSEPSPASTAPASDA